MGKKKRPEKGIHDGNMVSWMDRPNLLVPLEASDDHPRAFFPLLKLREADEEGGLGQDHGLFFDEMHGPGWFEWTDRAPTFMDPHKFVAMAMEHPRVRGCLRVCHERNIMRPATRDMPEMLDAVMEEYLVYLLERFERVKPYLIEWMVKNHSSQETDPTRPRRKKRTRKKRTPAPAEE